MHTDRKIAPTGSNRNRLCDPNAGTGWAAWAIAIGFLIMVSAAHGRRNRYKVYKNKKYRFRLLIPKGWLISEQKTHPSILMALRHQTGAEMRVAVKVEKQRITLKAFAKKEAQIVAKLGFPVKKLKEMKLAGRKALRLHGRHPKLAWDFALYFVQRKRMGYVLTLNYPRAQEKKLRKDIDLILRSFNFISK
jgi:hypothetical protein